MDYESGIVNWRRVIPTSESYYAFAAAPYSGPGDVVSGAAAWWGLRGYSRAVSTPGTTNAVRLRRDSDNAEQDFVILASGNLDVASISTFKSAANLFVTKLYDQTGGGNDLAQATAANQPGLTLSGLGSLPIMTFGGSQFVNRALGANLQNEPFSLSTVALRSNTSGSFALGSANVGIFFHGANTVSYLNSSFIDLASNDGVWHAIQSADNSGLAVIYSDGTSASGSLSANNISANIGLGAAGDGSGFFLTGNLVEGGVWPGVFSATQAGNMNSNQHSYWGF